MSEPLTAEEVQQQKAALQEAYDQKRILAREAAQERRRRLAALGPEFVRVIKAGQVFTRFTADGPEEVFVWFEQPPGRSGVLHWEPVAPEGEPQPRVAVPERSLKFAAISDIFMGRATDVLEKYVDKAGMRLCISFVAHMGSEVPSLHLKARKKLQMEAWMYGVQHILKQGGFHFLEANETLDRKEREIFEKYTAKQIVRMLEKKSPDIAGLRLQATLNLMNRGQVFKRYLPDNSVTKTLLFFCSDGGLGTLFWGPRSHPEGFLRLRHVTDVWLGKHDLLKQPVAEAADPLCCVSLVSKHVKLALEAPSPAVMSQWMFGIHSLLTAPKEVLDQINSAGVGSMPNTPQKGATTEEAQKEKVEAQAAALAEAQAAEAEAAEAQAKAQAAVTAGDKAAAAALREAAERAAARAAQLAQAALASTRIQLNLDDDEDFDIAALGATSADDRALRAALDEMEAMYEDTAAKLAREREERRKAELAREAARERAEKETRALEEELNQAGSAALDAINRARALRERALAESQALQQVRHESQKTVEDVLALAAQALGEADGEGDGLADYTGAADLDIEDSDSEEETGAPPNTHASPGESKTEDDFEIENKPGRGRRLSLFSALDLDEDVKQALSFDGSSPLSILDDLAGTDSADTAAEDTEALPAEDGDEWTTLLFDVGTSELAEGATTAAAVPAEPEGEAIAAEAEAQDEGADAVNNGLSIAIPEEGEAEADEGEGDVPQSTFQVPEPPSDDEGAPETVAEAEPEAEPSPTAAAATHTPVAAKTGASRLTGSAARPTSRLTTPGVAGTRSATTPSASGSSVSRLGTSSARTPSAATSSSRLSTTTTPVSRLSSGRATTPATSTAATPTASRIGTRPTSAAATATPAGRATAGAASTTTPGATVRRSSLGSVGAPTPARTPLAGRTSMGATSTAATPRTSAGPTPGSRPGASSSSTTPRPGSAVGRSSMGTTSTTTPGARTSTGATGSAARPAAGRTTGRVAIHIGAETPTSGRTSTGTPATRR